ncbi:MAG: hydantoinase/oxoprolinase family protein [Ectothiorhodospiraceae bacterium]|nr:hydantoinase/oxoprolinase family protein [Ectothiorhodospiraceae bacterium]
MWRMAFDIGGTFTDFVLAGPDTPPRFLKAPTTPADPSRAVVDGFERLLAEAGVGADALATVLHATTVATNAIIERKGAPTALITTAGFRDVLVIGRQKRYETYDLYMDKPPPLVPRRRILEVTERLGPDGTVEVALDPASVDAAIDALLASDARSVAVALLHAYASPAHEQAVAERLRARAPDLPVSLSSRISPKFREYERTSTTVANAYVRPIVGRYIERLEGALAARGFRNDIFIMQSAGGLVSPDLAAEEPVRIVESGPAAGVLMSALVGAAAGEDHVITFDMGGTTAKLGAVDAGEPAVTPTFEVDPIRYRPGSGLPINVPAIELLEIGAGGGSIARAEFGVIHVGPESAGADPGPICYGRGGDRATVTDANLVLGYLNPAYFNAGEMALDVDAARAGVARDVARPLDLSVERAAWGVHAAANANMERAMRIVSVERGRDPRRYAIVAFGGAGPVHAARLARAVGAPRVIVPFGAGVGSAIGLLQAVPKIETSMTRVLAVDDGTEAAIADIYAELQRRARADVARLGVPGEPVFSRYGYLRYRGQGYEIRADLPSGAIGTGYAAGVRAAFHEAYQRSYGYRDERAGIEAVDWHLVATLPGDGRALDLGWRAPSGTGTAPSTRLAWFPETEGFVETAIHDRRHLGADAHIEGPAVVEDPEATIVVPPGTRARMSAQGHLVIETGASA